MISCNLQKM